MNDKQLPVTGSTPAAKMQPVALDNSMWKQPGPAPAFSPLLQALDTARQASVGQPVPTYDNPPTAPKGGMKFDGGKPKWSLLMRGLSQVLEGVVAVLGFGAQKYAADSWQEVDGGYERYKDALYRHLARIEQLGAGAIDADMQPDGKGGYVDKGSGLLDWFHVVCDAMFCAWFAAKLAREAAAKATR